MLLEIFKWFLTACIIVGTLLLTRKNKWGWLVSIVGSIGWLWYMLSIREYALAFNAVAMLIIRLDGLRRWFGL